MRRVSKLPGFPRRMARLLGYIFFSASLLVSAAHAQQPATPHPPLAETASPSAVANPPAQPHPMTEAAPPPVHRFWDKENCWLFAGIGVVRGLDFASTRNFRARGRQEILLTNSIVDNDALFAGIEAATAGLSIGGSYWLHRTGHHKLERWVSFVHIGVTGFGVVRNYSLRSARPHIRSAN
jgi:hypothetical protein